MPNTYLVEEKRIFMPCPVHLTSGILALSIGTAGIGLLYASWLGRLSSRAIATATGWMLLALSMYVWARSAGVEFGSVFGLIIPALLAWALILSSIDRRNRRARDERIVINAWPTFPAVLRNLGMFVVTVPLLGAVSAVCSVAFATLIPIGDIDRIVLAVFLMPVLWGALAFWACADSKPRRPLAVVTGLAAIGVMWLTRLSSA
jgi:hypothetical protein